MHPTLTTRAKTIDRAQAANLAARYLRVLLESVGPVYGHLGEAFSFSISDTLSRRGRRGRRKTDDANSPNKGNEQDIDNDLASVEALWTRGEDFWHVIGWAFKCSVVHKRRWEVWRAWLDYMLDVLESDWNLRFVEGREALRQSLVIRYIHGEGETASNEKRILRAIFSDGQGRYANEFSEVWPNETKELKKGNDIKKAERRIDIDADDYGDYIEDEDDADLEDASQPSPPVRSVSPRKRNHKEVSNKIPNGAEPLGGIESLTLRLRLQSLLSKVAHHLPDQFVHSTTLYDLYLEHIRHQPVPTFSLIISPTGLRHFTIEAASSLTQFILRTLISASAPAPPDDRLDQDILEECYLPFAANKATMVDNAKVSICVETLVRLLDRYTSTGLEWTVELQAAMEKGVEERMKKARKMDVETGWLEGSARRIGAIVGMARRRSTD